MARAACLSEKQRAYFRQNTRASTRRGQYRRSGTYGPFSVLRLERDPPRRLMRPGSGPNRVLHRRRRAAPIALGVSRQLPINTAGSGRGPWCIARPKALSVGLSNAYCKSLGLLRDAGRRTRTGPWDAGRIAAVRHSGADLWQDSHHGSNRPAYFPRILGMISAHPRRSQLLYRN
jgi:hypothetical protein